MDDPTPSSVLPSFPPAEKKEETPSQVSAPAPVNDAQMSGALKTPEPPKEPTPQPPAAVSSANGAPDTTTESAANKPKEDVSAPPQVPNDTSADTVMKDAPQPTPSVEASKPAEPADSSAEAPSNEPAADANGTPAAKGKRKSTGGVPEHKGKSLKKKQSKQKITNLDAKPGETYFARLRSYPPWPAIICDEEMLPSSLLNKRPVTAQREDGSWTEAYAEGGKKVADRTFPIMFLHTNEFYWMPNTDLTPMTPDECKDPAEKGKSKALLEAYKVAAEGHDLAHFKEILMAHAAAIQEEEDRREAKEAEKAAKADRKKRKSDVKAAKDDDVDMEDADGETKKSSKKRKKEAASDDEETEKPAKTPKTTKLKLTTGKTPTTAEKKTKEKAAKPKAERKKKAAAAASDEEAVETPEKEEEPPLDPVEARKAREKEVLFLRHKLQKGFLSRDQAPQEDEMPQMATYIKKLEGYGEKLEVAIIRNTKINKVLKALVKLNTIPKDEEFHFRERSVKLLGVWNQLLGAEPSEAEKAVKEDKPSPATTNGVHKEVEDKAEEKVEKEVVEPKEKVAEPAEAAEKIATEVSAPAEAKTEVINAVLNDQKPAETPVATESSAPKPEEPKPAEAPAVDTADKAPESAPAASEAINVIKATE